MTPDQDRAGPPVLVVDGERNQNIDVHHAHRIEERA
jgi:hypothetical protein